MKVDAATVKEIFLSLPGIFASCVNPDYPQFALPFVKDDWVYATDGRIIVRMPVPCDEVREALSGRRPRQRRYVDHLFTEIKFEAKPVPLPEIPGPATCRACYGRGVVFEKDLCYEHICDECHGGFVFDDKLRVEITPDIHLDHRRAHLLQRYTTEVYLPLDRKNHPVRFVARFLSRPDIEGRLQPLWEKP